MTILQYSKIDSSHSMSTPATPSRTQHETEGDATARPNGRSGSGVVTTTTLLALVAVAAAACFTPQGRAAQVETRVLLDGSPARTVATAVAIVARDLLGGDHGDELLILLSWSGDLPPFASPEMALRPSVGTRLHPEPLREALLDLPPPTR